MKMNLTKVVEEIRSKLKGKSPVDICSKTGLSYRTVSGFIAGSNHSPNLTTLQKLQDYVNQQMES